MMLLLFSTNFSVSVFAGDGQTADDTFSAAAETLTEEETLPDEKEEENTLHEEKEETISETEEALTEDSSKELEEESTEEPEETKKFITISYMFADRR